MMKEYDQYHQHDTKEKEIDDKGIMGFRERKCRVLDMVIGSNRSVISYLRKEKLLYAYSRIRRP